MCTVRARPRVKYPEVLLTPKAGMGEECNFELTRSVLRELRLSILHSSASRLKTVCRMVLITTKGGHRNFLRRLADAKRRNRGFRVGTKHVWIMLDY